MRRAVALLLLSCATARPTPVDERTRVHVPQLAARDAPAAEAINQQLKREFEEMASCAPNTAESVDINGDITLRSPHVIGVVAYVEAFCFGALHPIIEKVSFFFDAVSGARLPAVLKPDAETELERRFREKAGPPECDGVVANDFLLEPREDGLFVTTNVGWAVRPCAQSVLLTWKELDGLLAHPP